MRSFWPAASRIRSRTGARYVNSGQGAHPQCPACGRPSSWVHGRYQRLLADGAAVGRSLDRAVGAPVPLRFGPGLAGRAGARLAAVLGIAVHSSALMQLVLALPDPVATASPRVTRVDDFVPHRLGSPAC